MAGQVFDVERELDGGRWGKVFDQDRNA